MFNSLKSDRKRAIYTCSLFLSSFFVGLVSNSLGVVLLDVMEMTHVSFSTSASYIIALHIGEITGSVILGIMRQMSDPFLAMAVCTGIMAVSTAVLPWCTLYTTFFIACIVIGTPIGFLRPFQLGEMAALWGEEGKTFMVILYTVRKVATMMSMLFISIFLSPNSDVHLEYNNVTDTSMQTTSPNLYIPFTSIAVLQLGGAFLFLLLYMWFRKHQVPDLYSVRIKEDSEDIHRTHKIAVYITMVVIAGLINAFNFGTNSFIASFIVKEFNASRKHAAYVNILFNAFAIIGRSLIIFAMQFFSHFQLVFFTIFVTITGTICLYLCSLYDAYFILVCGSVALVAMGCFPTSSLLPVVITGSFFPVTRTTANVISFSGTFTDIMQSLLKGYLMQDLGPIQLNEIMMVESFLIFIFFAVLFGLKIHIYRQKASVGEPETTDMLKR